MRFLLRHLLLLGAILGLAGQGVASASTPCPMMQHERAAAMAGTMAGMSDCDMCPEKSGNGSAPCKDMSLGCMAMAGCAALIAVDTISPSTDAPLPVASLAHWSAIPILLGRSIAPDPDPPSILG